MSAESRSQLGVFDSYGLAGQLVGTYHWVHIVFGWINTSLLVIGVSGLIHN